MESAFVKHQQQSRERYSWVRLFDGLRDWVRVRGIDQLTDDALKGMDKNIALEWIVGPQAEGPQALVLQAFREDAELWLSACPAEDVVVVPREIFTRIIAALPPAITQIGALNATLPSMSADEWARTMREQLICYADRRRAIRERAERDDCPDKKAEA